MAQSTLFEIFAAVIGIDQFTGFRFGHGVDGEIAALQIVFEADIGGGMKRKAGITRCSFALGASEGILFMAVGMQKYRKILAYRFVAGGEHVFRCGTHYNPVTILDRESEEFITNATAYFINLHIEPLMFEGGAVSPRWLFAPRVTAQFHVAITRGFVS